MTAVPGARCAIHPDRDAESTCGRCGNFACVECDVGGFESSALCVSCAEGTAPSRYHVVPPWRFVLLYALSFGAYALWWFWRNWTLIKRHDRNDIWPFVRAFFAGFTYFSLIGDINTRFALRSSEKRLSSGLGVGFLVSSMLYRLPDPYSMVSLLGVVFLVPAVVAIRDLASESALADGARWRLRHTLVLLVAVPFFILATIGMLVPVE